MHECRLFLKYAVIMKRTRKQTKGQGGWQTNESQGQYMADQSKKRASKKGSHTWEPRAYRGIAQAGPGIIYIK